MAQPEYPRPSQPVEESFTQLTRQLQSDVRDLVSTETALVKHELQQKLDRLKVEAKAVAVASASMVLGAMALVATMILVLNLWMPAWAAALIVTGLLTVVALVLFSKVKVTATDLMPNETANEMRRNVDTMKEAL